MDRKAVTIQVESDYIPAPVSAYEIAQEDGYSGSEEQYTKEMSMLARDITQDDFDALPTRIDAQYTKGNISGEGVLAVTDSVALQPLGLKLYGKSTQKTYEGTNILPPNIAINGTGLDVSINDNGEFVVSGTTKDEVSVDLYLAGAWNGTSAIDLGIRGNVTFCCDDENIRIYVSHYDGSSTSLVTSGQSLCNATITDDNYITGISFRFLQNTAYNKTIRFWAYYGTEKKDFEPYVGGEASPNLNYQQKVTPIGESGSVTEKVLTSNLFNYNILPYLESASNINGGIITVEDGKLTVDATNATAKMTAKSTWLSPSKKQILIPKGVYYFGFGTNGYYLDEDGNVINENVQQSIGIRTLEKPYVIVQWYVGCGVGTKNETYLEINPIQKLPYEPYTEQLLTLQTPNGLHGIPLGQTIPDVIANSPIHMSGVYWDTVEGQYYIGDTEDGNGEITRRCYRCVLTGNENFVINTAWVKDSTIAFYMKITDTPSVEVYNGLSNFAIADSTLNSVDKNCFRVGLDTVYIRVSKDILSEVSVDALKTLLKAKYDEGNPYYIDYILAEPIITDLTDEEIAAYEALKMNYPNTTILNDAGAYTEVEYVRDPIIHLTNLKSKHTSDMDKLKAAVVALGGTV